MTAKLSTARKAALLTAVASFTAAIFLGSHVFFLGLSHVSTASAYRAAADAWGSRDYSSAWKFFSLAVGMTWRGGFRSQAASRHIAQLQQFREEGDLEDALRECTEAVRDLGMYDDEGAVSYLCLQIENEISAGSACLPLERSGRGPGALAGAPWPSPPGQAARGR